MLTKKVENMSGEDSKVTPETRQRPSLIVHLLVTIFGMSAWIGVNGIFIQLPLLVISLPEGWALAAYLVVVIQAANVAPLAYSLFRKFSLKVHEDRWILGLLVVGSSMMGLLALFHDKTAIVFGAEHSVALFVLTFFVAAISCTSSVLFMPYLRNFKAMYLMSYFVGEGLGGVIPGITALLQGIGGNPSCVNITSTRELYYPPPRFSPHDYFLIIFTFLILSLTAFVLLEKLSLVNKERIGLPKDISLSDEICSCQKTEGNISSIRDADSTLRHVYLYALLASACLLTNGLLPGLQPYSCLSYGNLVYHLTATCSQLANPIACFLTLWYLPLNIRLINGLSIVILIVSSYIIYLASLSPELPFKDSDLGGILVISSWTLLVGLVSYLKLTITSVFRRESKSLYKVGVVMQLGSACGAVLSFVLINCTTLLKVYTPCSHSGN